MAPAARTCASGGIWVPQVHLSRPRHFSCLLTRLACPEPFQSQSKRLCIILEGRPVLSLHTGLLDPERSRPLLRGPDQVSSLEAASKVPKLDSAAFRPPSAKPVPQSPFCSPLSGAQRPPGPKQHLVQPPSAKAALSSRRQKCLATWMCLLQALGSASLLWTQIQHSSNAAEHTATAVRKFAVRILETHLSLCFRFVHLRKP